MTFYAGAIRLEGDTITYSSSYFGEWTLPLSDLKVIGEYTNEDGPFLDDYFFVFVADPHESWYEASFFAEGRDLFLTELGARLGCRLTCSLCNSARFRSRVWWPPQLAGQDMFQLRPKHWYIPCISIRRLLSVPVMDYLKTPQPPIPFLPLSPFP